MTDLLTEFLLKAAAMMPVMLGTGAAMWWLGRLAGWVDPSAPFKAYDVRTWPFRLVMVAFTVFALANAAASFWIDPDLAAGVGAFVAFGIMPVFLTSKNL